MEQQQNPNFPKLIFSTLTAVATGASLAFLFIFGSNIALSIMISPNTQTATASQVEISKKVENESSKEEQDQDPSFVSKFSRVFIYSADNGKEIIENAKNSLPKLANIKVSAKAYAVVDLDRGVIIIEKNSEKLLPIASISKIVTAVVAKQLLKENDSITIKQRELNTYGNEGWLRLGEKMKVHELFYPLLMVSSNDAAEVLAQSYSGGRKNFIKKMNDWVSSIGAYRTYFADPSGLSSKNVSTAKDLSIIVNWILKNDPNLFKITLLKSKSIRMHTWVNPTHFLNLTSYAGGKNGYTPEANRTSVALFKLGKYEKPYAIILLGSSNRDADILDLLQEALR